MISRKQIMFLFFAGQLVVGLVLLFNPIQFDVLMRVFGLFLIAISPLWLIMYRLERYAKAHDANKA